MVQQATPIRIVKSTYYSNWGDRIGYPLAALIVKPLAKIPGVTPNQVTLTAFTMFALGSISLALSFPYHLPIAAALIFAGYVGDDVDGQLARLTKQYSVIGDYLDKVLDVLKLFLVTFFAGLSVYLATGQIRFIMLGFVACFMFLYRYYIKLETMFSALSRNPEYLEQSSQKRSELEHNMDVVFARRPTSPKDGLDIFWIKNRTLFIVDEAEFAIFVALGAVLDRLGIVLWVLAVSQAIWVGWRVFERGSQLKNNSKRLFWPLRK